MKSQIALTFLLVTPLGCQSTAVGEDHAGSSAAVAHTSGEGAASSGECEPGACEGCGEGTTTPVSANSEGRTFGADLSPELNVTALRDMLDAPARFSGQTVRTEGEIAQVCQRMGCWMELRPDEGGDAIHVPMAGHSFFLPRDVVGKRATVEGEVQVRRLDAKTIEHLRSEGAQATGESLSIVARAVVVHETT